MLNTNAYEFNYLICQVSKMSFKSNQLHETVWVQKEEFIEMYKDIQRPAEEKL